MSCRHGQKSKASEVGYPTKGLLKELSIEDFDFDVYQLMLQSWYQKKKKKLPNHW